MDKVRFGIVGCGNMGVGHSKNFLEGKIDKIDGLAEKRLPRPVNGFLSYGVITSAVG